jgi:hypothetical protein
MDKLLHLSTEAFILIEIMVKEYFDHLKPAVDYSNGENGYDEDETIDDYILDAIAWLRTVNPDWWVDEIDHYIESWHVMELPVCELRTTCVGCSSFDGHGCKRST